MTRRCRSGHHHRDPPTERQDHGHPHIRRARDRGGRARQSFGDTLAVAGVDLAVPAGTVYGVLGPNGAGKTTTIRMLATLLQPDGGSARVLGHDIVAEADAVRAQVSLTGQLASVDEDLTGRENLVLIGRCRGCGAARPASGRCELLAAFGLTEAGGPAGEDLLRRHAPPARHRREHRGDAAADVPGRAHHRAGPALAQRRVGHRAGPRRGRHHHPAVHPVPRRGRPARRPHRGDRPRPRHRRGHARRAEGVGGHGHAHTSACVDPADRPAAAEVLERVLGEVQPAADPRGPLGAVRRPGPRRRGARRAGRRRAWRCRSSRSAARAWTRCSWRSPATRRRRRTRRRRHDDDAQTGQAGTDEAAILTAVSSRPRPGPAEPPAGRDGVRVARRAEDQARAGAAARLHASRRCCSR